jgi:hypothetical protein
MTIVNTHTFALQENDEFADGEDIEFSTPVEILRDITTPEGEAAFVQFLGELEQKNDVIIEFSSPEVTFSNADGEPRGEKDQRAEGLMNFDVVDVQPMSIEEVKQLTSRVHNDLVDFMRRPLEPSGE